MAVLSKIAGKLPLEVGQALLRDPDDDLIQVMVEAAQRSLAQRAVFQVPDLPFEQIHDMLPIGLTMVPVDLTVVELRDRNDPNMAALHVVQTDFLKVRGKRFEARTFASRAPRGVPSYQVNDHFAERGYEGNSALMALWAGKHATDGVYATPTIAPIIYLKSGSQHSVGILSEFIGFWHESLTHVAFREVT